MQYSLYIPCFILIYRVSNALSMQFSLYKPSIQCSSLVYRVSTQPVRCPLAFLTCFFFGIIFFLHSFSTRFARLDSARFGSKIYFALLLFLCFCFCFFSISLSHSLFLCVFLVIVRQKFLLNWN